MSDTGRIHQTPGETRERTYERLRRSGITPDNARRISEEAARQTHDTLNRDRQGR
jgi:hypothetical protein